MCVIKPKICAWWMGKKLNVLFKERCKMYKKVYKYNSKVMKKLYKRKNNIRKIKTSETKPWAHVQMKTKKRKWCEKKVWNNFLHSFIQFIRCDESLLQQDLTMLTSWIKKNKVVEKYSCK